MGINGWQWLNEQMRDIEYEKVFTSDSVNVFPSEWIWELEWVVIFSSQNQGICYRYKKKKRSYFMLPNAPVSNVVYIPLTTN